MGLVSALKWLTGRLRWEWICLPGYGPPSYRARVGVGKASPITQVKTLESQSQVGVLESKESSWASNRGLPDHEAPSHGRQPRGTLLPLTSILPAANQALDLGHMRRLPGGFWAKGPSLGKGSRHPVLPWTLLRPLPLGTLWNCP